MIKYYRFSFYISIALFASTLLRAQTATISGTVTDPSGAGVSGAKVTAKNEATGVERSTETSDSGAYSIPNVKPGRYDVQVERTGFAVHKFDSVELTVGQNLSLNTPLQVGQITESVDVSGSTVAPIELENAQISNIVDSRRILDLPLLTRDPYSLVLLSSGVVQSNSSLGGFSINGSRERNNNFLLDGADNNDTSVPGIAGGLIALNPDSTQEFRVITNNFLPEYGRNTGAIINVISRSGTNDFHGDAYWFGRYHALAARDYFNAKGEQQNPFVRNIFGWAFGGPIKKDRTFFFVNNEYQRFRTTLNNTSIVPTAAFKSGIFNFEGQAINLADPNSPNNVQRLPLDPTVQKMLALLPNPNGEAVDDVRGIYRFPSSSRQDTATVTFKVDHRLTEKHNLSLRYSYGGLGDPNPFHDGIAPGLGETGTNSQAHAIAANLISTFTPTIVNEFRAGVNRSTSSFTCGGFEQFDSAGRVDPFGLGSDFALLGIGGSTGALGIGCSTLGNSNGQLRRTGTWNLNDGLTWVKGNHTLKFGGEFRYVFENGYNAFGSRTSYSFNAFDFGVPVVNLDPNNPCDPESGDFCGGRQFQNLAAGLLGLVDTQSQSQFFDKNGARTPLDYRKYVQHEYAAYAQDSWKVLPNLTLNFGLRYQFNGVPFERDGNLSNLFANPAGAAPFTFGLVGPGSGRNLYDNDFTNFEPRFGFSWDPFSSGKTAIRGGYGIFHDRVFGNLFGNASGNPPFLQTFQEFPFDALSNVPVPGTVPTSATVGEGFYQSAVLMDPKFKIPYSQNWNLGIQHELPGATTVELNYIGSKGNRLFRVVDGNPPQPELVQRWLAEGIPPSALQLTTLYILEQDGGLPSVNNTALLQPSLLKSIGNSTYHSMQVKVTRRLLHGVQIQGAYTWAHAIDDAGDPIVPGDLNRSFPRNSLNLRAERGNSDFDQRQRLVLNYIWELPFGRGRAYLKNGIVGRVLEGWQLTGISTFQDGLPFEIWGNRDSEHTGLTGRADLVGDPSIPSGSPRTQTGPVWSAFALAPFGRGGTVGRNSFVGPGSINTDLMLSKDQILTERVRMQLRLEAYNLFNRAQFTQPGNNIANPGTFGLSTSTVTRPDFTSSNRQLQLGLKLIF